MTRTYTEDPAQVWIDFCERFVTDRNTYPEVPLEELSVFVREGGELPEGAILSLLDEIASLRKQRKDLVVALDEILLEVESWSDILQGPYLKDLKTESRDLLARIRTYLRDGTR